MKDILSLIPYEVNDYLKSLIKGQDLIIKTVPKRRTKHGDYRKLNNKHIITINHIDNKYRFLLILIHELAHFNIYKKILELAHMVQYGKTSLKNYCNLF